MLTLLSRLASLRPAIALAVELDAVAAGVCGKTSSMDFVVKDDAYGLWRGSRGRWYEAAEATVLYDELGEWLSDGI